MPKIDFPLALPRRFEVWSYRAPHGVLVLRSDKGADAPTRVDVVFRAVSEVKLATVMTNLVVDRAGGAYTLASNEMPDAYVVAANALVFEDDLEGGQPSVAEDPALERHVIRSLYHHRY
ncbi:hypothetical protein [Saccharothrix coeruleofusca]|uniref:Uncharacterized protein n=1 Tax=Saccharothrix coeruleofusca TaxID=33919 RepID=A0A918AS58_9PSEU|nr:hypothetical protein [Saccharothrix coeruleofusca]MBP2335975.1 hypothetical protein [Saccharothrix coeruleofusca]GGP76241.1 hypothetical protein GCM10010185_57410 [Saccharothrix coeruleofusca]